MGVPLRSLQRRRTGVTEVLLEHLTRFEGFGAVLDDRFTPATGYSSLDRMARCIYTLRSLYNLTVPIFSMETLA
jgi:hypothetical protein